MMHSRALKIGLPTFFAWILCLFVTEAEPAADEIRTIKATAYCWCGECNGYTRGRWRYLKLNFWNRYNTYGSVKGKKYIPRTASGTRLHAHHPGLFSLDSLKKPWMIPVRIVFFPWLLLPQKGTIAADTKHFPFGTKMYVPGYGWGVVEDRGGAIKGPARIDLYYPLHALGDHWGVQTVEVRVVWPD